MIKDQFTFSARAESTHNILRNLVAVTLGGVIALAPFAARSEDEQIALPPIPQLDTMPWLSWPQAPSTVNVDTLLSPSLDAPRLRFDLLPTQREGTQTATS